VRIALVLLAAALSAAPGPALAQKAEPVREEVLGQYRLALLEQIRNFKNYPKEALELQIEGTAVVRLSIDAGGRIKSSRTEPSSAYAVLDAAALEMVRKAHPLVALPKDLRGRSFDVSVPVTFRIRTE
jgi:protein TonB